MESNDGQIQHVTTTLEFASLGARPYNYRYMDLHDIAFVFHGRMISYILFVTTSHYKEDVKGLAPSQTKSLHDSIVVLQN